MILRALYDYYQRDKDSIPFGLQKANISFLIVIENDGTFCSIEDCRQGKKGTDFFVPTGEHNNSISPLLFWDNVQYLLDYTPDYEPLSEVDSKNANKVKTRSEKIQKSHEKHLAFVNRCKSVAEESGEKELLAVSLFYSKNQLQDVYKDKLWTDIKKKPLSWLSFRVKGKLNIVASNTYFSSDDYLSNIKADDNDISGICLITGLNSSIARLCKATPITGAKSSAKLVSFNDNSYCSYGKEQGGNAPISKEAEFAFSSAILKMLDNNSHNKFSIGNRTFLFWASSQTDASKAAEDSLFALFGYKEDSDDPNKRIEFVQRTFLSIYNGSLPSNKDDRFYILGLAPNSARIAVVYWSELPLREFAGTIGRHFEDMEIVDTRKEKKPYSGLHAILGTVTLSGKSSDASPNLPDAIVKSIFQGTPYPVSLYQACIRRIRAEQALNITRAATIKAYLNRLIDNNKKIEIMLDKENQNQGYLCGRLFAVLDKIQEDANGIHSIRERYINSASSTPATVFATIINLSTHHIEKLKPGSQIYYEKLKQEIMSKLPADGFPTHLDLQNQGRFFVGYYHQRQDFFITKDNKE